MKIEIEIPEGYEVKTQTLKHFEGFEAIVIELKKITRSGPCANQEEQI